MTGTVVNTEDFLHDHSFVVMSPKGLARRARDARSEAQVSQSELAERIGVDRSAISKAERYDQGDGFTSLRKRIIEELTDAEVKGPLYQMDEPGLDR